MPPRANWNGYLKLSLVTGSLALFPATSDKEKVSFHFLNGATGHRLEQQYVDKETGRVVNRERGDNWLLIKAADEAARAKNERDILQEMPVGLQRQANREIANDPASRKWTHRPVRLPVR
jgi:non-homologous end joining protein Ku